MCESVCDVCGGGHVHITDVFGRSEDKFGGVCTQLLPCLQMHIPAGFWASESFMLLAPICPKSTRIIDVLCPALVCPGN